MIQSFKHRGLKRFFENNDGRRVNPDHIPRLKRILATLDAASRPEDMDAPGWSLHKLRGDLKEFYAVKVSGNWRVIFRLEDGDAYDVDYLDYH